MKDSKKNRSSNNATWMKNITHEAHSSHPGRLSCHIEQEKFQWLNGHQLLNYQDVLQSKEASVGESESVKMLIK